MNANELSSTDVVAIVRWIKIEHAATIANGNLNKPNGYKIKTFKGKKVLLHHVLWRFANSFALIDVALPVSHLCGVATCATATHLIQESVDENESRKFCHKQTWPIEKCPHEPRCTIHWKQEKTNKHTHTHTLSLPIFILPVVTFLSPLTKNLFNFQEIKGSQRRTFMVSIDTENENQWSFCLYTLQFVSVKFELHLVRLRYSLTSMPPQPNSQVECVNNKEVNASVRAVTVIWKQETNENWTFRALRAVFLTHSATQRRCNCCRNVFSENWSKTSLGQPAAALKQFSLDLEKKSRTRESAWIPSSLVNYLSKMNTKAMVFHCCVATPIYATSFISFYKFTLRVKLDRVFFPRYRFKVRSLCCWFATT